MAATIFTVLSNIPWGQVVDNAPKVAEAATRLWDAVTGFGKAKGPTARTAAGATEATPLEARMAELEAGIASLQEQMQASSELIKALAEQNAQLVQRSEEARLRFIRTASAGLACIVVLAGAVAYLLLAG